MSPAPHLPACVCATLRQVTRAVTQLYDDALRPAGLRAMQFQMLMTLRHLGGATITELGPLMTLDQTTLTRSLAGLARRGWVERIPQPDRRLKWYRVSAVGGEVLETARPLWEAAQNQVLARVGVENWQAARAPLAALLDLAEE